MDAERWQEVGRVYQAALEQPPDARGDFLIEACGGDEALRREVESLLAQEHVDTFVDRDVDAIALDLFDRPRALSPGTMVGSYRVVDLIGSGGMGEVYRAFDVRLQRDVAIKILPDIFVDDADRIARFTREAHALASLNHPNIAAIYDVEEGGDMRALVLELVDGPTLADRIAQGALNVDEALSIARQIAAALQAAHEHGVIHRDLKPANIKVREDGTVKVLDFGLATAAVVGGEVTLPTDRTAARSTPSPAASSPTVTRGGMILGTAAYIAPEQATWA